MLAYKVGHTPTAPFSTVFRLWTLNFQSLGSHMIGKISYFSDSQSTGYDMPQPHLALTLMRFVKLRSENIH